MTSSSDLWDADTAERYDEESSFMFRPDVLDPAVSFLAELAGEGPALEFAIGTGRVAIPLIDKGIAVSGIELAAPMVRRPHAKRPDVPVVVGDMATARVEASSRSSTWCGTAWATFGPRPSRSRSSATPRGTWCQAGAS